MNDCVTGESASRCWLQFGEMSDRGDPWQEEVGAAHDRHELWHRVDPPPDGIVGDRHQPACLGLVSDEWVRLEELAAESNGVQPEPEPSSVRWCPGRHLMRTDSSNEIDSNFSAITRHFGRCDNRGGETCWCRCELKCRAWRLDVDVASWSKSQTEARRRASR